MATSAKLVGGLRREQQVVDADAVVPLPGAGLIVPEGVGPGVPSAWREGVGQAEPLHERAEGCPRLRLEEGVAQPRRRIVGVLGLGMTL